MRRRPVRIIDIARRLDISAATVSAVLNHKADAGRISKQTQAAVWTTAREMGYQPNIAARRLRSAGGRNANSVYVAVVAPLDTPLTVVGSVFRGVQLFANSSDVPLQLTIETFRPGELSALPGLLDGSRFNGAIITNTAPEDDDFLAETEVPVPLVVFLRQIKRCSYVTSDGFESGYQAGKLLLQNGRQRPAALVPASTTQARLARLAGYRQALAERGFFQFPELVGDFTERGGYEGMLAFLQGGQRCDALFAIGDIMAFGAMAAIKQHGLTIPGDVALVGHDDLEVASFTDPPLTTFHLPLVEMAYDAAQMLVALLEGTASTPIHRVYPANLVKRGSA